MLFDLAEPAYDRSVVLYLLVIEYVVYLWQKNVLNYLFIRCIIPIFGGCLVDIEYR